MAELVHATFPTFTILRNTTQVVENLRSFPGTAERLHADVACLDRQMTAAEDLTPMAEKGDLCAYLAAFSHGIRGLAPRMGRVSVAAVRISTGLLLAVQALRLLAKDILPAFSGLMLAKEAVALSSRSDHPFQGSTSKSAPVCILRRQSFDHLQYPRCNPRIPIFHQYAALHEMEVFCPQGLTSDKHEVPELYL